MICSLLYKSLTSGSSEAAFDASKNNAKCEKITESEQDRESTYQSNSTQNCDQEEQVEVYSTASAVHTHSPQAKNPNRIVEEIVAKYREDQSTNILIHPTQSRRSSLIAGEVNKKRKGFTHRKGSEHSVILFPSPDRKHSNESTDSTSNSNSKNSNSNSKSNNNNNEISTSNSLNSNEESERNSRSFFTRFKRIISARQRRRLFILNTLDFAARLLLGQPKFNQKFFSSVISQISFKTFQKCIGGDVEKVIKQNEDSHEKKMANLGEKQDYSHIKLDHLVFIKKLGFGQFGVVYLVRNKDNGALYALKSVSKNQIIEQNLEKHLLQEKTVLESVNFSFIMQFLRTFKDQQSVYFLVEFISGMELFDVIRDIGLLSTQDSQFYIGTLILCMEYLHGRNIIYRDIKPENIMVDSKGYMYMIDMGTAKILKQAKHPGRTFTIIGTPHYMAPEIIQGKGYSYAADLWSVGICLYEFMCGGVPYAEEAEDPYEIYEEIIKRTSVKYPASLKDKKAKRLIDQLLSKVPELRLGGSFAALKAHPWFDNFNWDELYSKKMETPYVPPATNIISEKEINAIAKEGKLVINEIKHEQEKSKQYNKDRARDPNWDKDF